ncbi:MAG: DUF58 domain-containing protein [Bdellovibrionota bacterium]
MSDLKEYGHRRLHVSVAGKWYLALTIGLGVVATSSGNNVLYLLESFLLGGLILSGVLSELAVASIQIQWTRSPCIASERAHDRIIVRNRGRLPVFCMEVGEWAGRKLIAHGFVPYLPPKSEIVVSSKWIAEKRGIHKWDGIGCSTSYPFGFATKIRWVALKGERLVWPRRLEKSGQTDAQGVKVYRTASGDFLEGEIREMQPDDDYRHVVWTLSARRGAPVVRVRKANSRAAEVLLDLRVDRAGDFEERIEKAASPFYASEVEGTQATLILFDGIYRRKIFGISTALDLLATVQPAPKGRHET